MSIMTRPVKNTAAATARNPKRSRERILAAALKEFAAKGFAGARVDVIARRASINKRMLYHYFGNKKHLFREVSAPENGGAAGVGGKFVGRSGGNACRSGLRPRAMITDWVRLLEWEALQGDRQKVIDEKHRRAATERGLERIRQRQARGQISAELDPRHVMLAMRSLTMFPVAFPQLTRIIMGRPVSDPQFKKSAPNSCAGLRRPSDRRTTNRVKINFVK